jgi:hypothetical protein
LCFFWWFIIPAVTKKLIVWYVGIALYWLFTASIKPKLPVPPAEDQYLKLGEDEVDNILQKGNQ